ncbi:hypothetical protein D9619_003646 [Psilocybe cf. subviscida]|uniref:peptidylprolyl isomerase n=1 Tax=Psilocybe cf. subviscida TaxID=2480587 RepID=A0A8H5AXK1_9AGAR|nr:hypothetical protein D9619_003646 [Psilocybe cf. subviscida]
MRVPTMDSLYDTLKNALQQAADCRKMFEDAQEESQRLATKYQDILAERQTLREANRALNLTIFELRAKVEDMETQLELQLFNKPCSCKTQGSTEAQQREGTLVTSDNTPSAPIPTSVSDGKDAEEVSSSECLAKKDLNDQSPSPGFTVQTISAGDGRSFPKKGDKVVMNYVATLVDGTKFASTYDSGEPYTVDIGMGRVHKGVMQLSLGQRAILVLTPDFAYGAQGIPSLSIPPNSTLKYEVELLKIN